ncbi:MAG TPA: DegT/DnrJ/EryC1/StrS family aminotransferase [Acidobacteriaceae bacterium]|nr:DegT/DnrJ/EryC1/StrS family aminotransferase [Acidobacteriaceae bacterium]
MNSHTNVPFLDLIAPHAELEEELTDVFRQAMRTAGFIGGPMVESFEKNFAAFCDAEHAIAVNSGTDALRFALIACGIHAGDVVVTVPHTFIATTEAISQAGAIPEFVDIDEATCNMSVEKLRHFLEERCTRDGAGRVISRAHRKPITAILPVHLYGQMADMDGIMNVAEEYGLAVLEDACQAQGAQYYSRRFNRWLTAGSVGIAAGFSFYPGKNLGACGEAGAVTTNDGSIAEKIRMLRDHGQAQKYYHRIEGYNGRLDAIQAGLLDVKLRRLAKWNAQRRELAAAYNRMLSDVDGVICPYEPSWSRGVYHLYVIRTENRDAMIAHLKDAGIGTGIHYPVPLHLQEAYRSFGHQPGDFPATERAAAQIVSLPMFPQLTAEQQARVVAEVCAFAKKSHRPHPLPEREVAEAQIA